MEPETEKPIKKPVFGFGWIRKLYDYVLSWAYKKYAGLALFVLAFIESSFFPIPPDVLQISLSVSRPKKSFVWASISLIGSVLGAVLGYFIGLFFYETIGQAIIHTLGYEHYFQPVGDLYNRYAFWAVITAAITPIPYKVFTIAAGVFQIAWAPFMLASVIGRGIRFFGVATLFYFFGPKIKEFIDKYFNILTVVFMILLIGGFVVIKYVV